MASCLPRPVVVWLRAQVSSNVRPHGDAVFPLCRHASIQLACIVEPRQAIEPIWIEFMRTESLEVYSDRTNHTVVRHPARGFPGSVIQGDTLSALCDDVRELSLRLKAIQANDEELLWIAQGVQQQLLERLLHYQTVLAEHGISLPYSTPATQDDLVTLVEAERGSAA